MQSNAIQQEIFCRNDQSCQRRSNRGRNPIYNYGKKPPNDNKRSFEHYLIDTFHGKVVKKDSDIFKKISDNLK